MSRQNLVCLGRSKSLLVTGFWLRIRAEEACEATPSLHGLNLQFLKGYNIQTN